MLALQDRFFYSFLSLEEKKVYQQLYFGLLEMKTHFTGLYGSINIKKIIDALFSDCPELYHVNLIELSYNRTNLWVTTREPFLYTKEELSLLKKRIHEVVSSFPFADNDFTNEINVHNFFVQNCEYNFEYFSHFGRGTTKEYENHTIIGPLLNHKAVCEGFAKAAQYLFIQMGIPAIVITGQEKNSTVLHEWLIVRINGEYYHLDISHDVCLSKDSPIPQYSYFNVTTEDLLSERIILDTKAKDILCTATKDNYYYKFHRYFVSLSQLRNALQTYIRSISPYETKRRFDFRLIKTCTFDDVKKAVHEILSQENKVQSVDMGSGRLNTFSLILHL